MANWNLERQKLHETYTRAQTALSLMRTSAKKAGTLTAETRYAIAQRNARAIPLANAAYNARINAEAARYEAAYFMLAQDLRERGVEQESAAAATTRATERQVLMTSAETNVRAADLMEQAAIAAGQAARDKAPPLPKEFEYNEQAATNETSVSPSYGWRPRQVNELMSPFYPLDVRRAAGALRGLGALGEGTDWWGKFKGAIGAGVAAAGNEAAKQGKASANDDPAAAAALNASGGTLQWLSTLLGADYQSTANKPAPSAPFPWAPVLIGAGVVGVGALVFLSMKKK